ncbi:MAG TPA: 50S ribosomal protein L22 [Pyrinomonadaceae bacterium]|nr:50S ribosomal protein L22 [Pyrinomonadaceae bacterium]
MEAIAKTRHLKGSPRKARLVIDLIRGRNVSQALNILKFTDKRAADPIAKTLRSAIANATYLAEQQNIAIDPDDLIVKTCFVDMGAHKNRRRMRPAPQGRAFREQRHYCHITILVSNDAPADTKSAKKSIQTSGEKGDGGAKMKDAPQPAAIKKSAKNDEVKESKKAKAEKTVTEETIATPMPVVETSETAATTVTPTAGETTVETLKNETSTAAGTQQTEETVESRAETTTSETPIETTKSDEPKDELTAEAGTIKGTNSESSDILEVESPSAEAKAKVEKQKAEASDVKNVQSQTPAERHETKQADERQLNENDILELQ